MEHVELARLVIGYSVEAMIGLIEASVRPSQNRILTMPIVEQAV